jgi:SAM-dependent methyltransferase
MTGTANNRDGDERARIVREFWVKQASHETAVVAVNPGARWAGMQDFTRRLLQLWTLDRMRAFRPRYRACVDIGCGYGDWTELFAQLSDEIHGCEIAPQFAAQARKRVPHAQIECCDLRSYVLPAKVDLVYLGAVLLYLPEDAVLDVLRRVRASMTADALVVWREFCTFNLGRRTVNETPERFSIHRSPAELCWLAELAGLRVTELRSAPSIYGEVLGGRIGRWPLRGLMRVATATWRRASHTLVLRPA